MVIRPQRERTVGVPRKRATYRAWKRNNALEWKGVEPDKKVEHPALAKTRSDKGEVHYVDVSEY